MTTVSQSGDLGSNTWRQFQILEIRMGDGSFTFWMERGDLKDFTYFPRKMKARFIRYRCVWTYMRASERRKAEFLKPKRERMFGKKEYRQARKGKVLGFTASNGRQVFVLCPSPWDSEAFAR